MFRAALPISDYNTDTKSVLDQSPRVVQAMIDIAADNGLLSATMYGVHLSQMISQARWMTDSPLLTLPHFTPAVVEALKSEVRSTWHLLCLEPTSDS